MASRLMVRDLHPAVPGMLIRDGDQWSIVVSPRWVGSRMISLVVDDLLVQLEHWEADEQSLRDAHVIRDTVAALTLAS